MRAAVRVGVQDSRSGALSARRLSRSLQRLHRDERGVASNGDAELDDAWFKAHATAAGAELLPDTSGHPDFVQPLSSPVATRRLASQPAGQQSAWQREGNLTIAPPGGVVAGVSGSVATQWRCTAVDISEPTHVSVE